MSKRKFLDLLTILLKETKEGKIQWHETVDEQVFRVAFGAGLVRVEERVSEHSTPDFEDTWSQTTYVALLRNKQGRTLDELWSGHEEVPEGFLHELYTTARASALSIDDTINSMIKDAEMGKTVEPPTEDSLRRE